MRAIPDCVNKKIELYERMPVEYRKPIVAGRLNSRKQSYLLACMPKSGSSWFRSIFSLLPSCTSSSMIHSYGGREQELDTNATEEMMQYNSGLNTISQHHVKYNYNTYHCLTQFCIRPIVMTRDIRDNLVSLVDHWKNYGCVPSYSYYLERDYFNSDFSSSISSSASPLEYATILHAPWVINFYLSWSKCHKNPDVRLDECITPIFVKYENMVANAEKCISRCLAEGGLACDPQEISDAISQASKKNTLLNKGITGRGLKAFEYDNGANMALESILRLYSHEDLREIGVY